jgi:hypothetical protein
MSAPSAVPDTPVDAPPAPPHSTPVDPEALPPPDSEPLVTVPRSLIQGMVEQLEELEALRALEPQRQALAQREAMRLVRRAKR